VLRCTLCEASVVCESPYLNRQDAFEMMAAERRESGDCDQVPNDEPDAEWQTDDEFPF